MVNESGTNRTFGDEIVTIAQHEISKLPVNMECTILRNYQNTNDYVDIKLGENNVLHYIPVIGDNTPGINGILAFLNGDNNQPVVITGNNQLQDLIGNIQEYINK